MQRKKGGRRGGSGIRVAGNIPPEQVAGNVIETEP
jgi:hypothetical protein